MTFQIEKQISDKDRYKIFLRLYSTLMDLKLSEKEINIIDAFFQVDNGLINTSSRKQVADILGMSEFNLNNYLYKMRNRNIVTDESIHSEFILTDLPAISKTMEISFLLISK